MKIKMDSKVEAVNFYWDNELQEVVFEVDNNTRYTIENGIEIIYENKEEMEKLEQVIHEGVWKNRHHD